MRHILILCFYGLIYTCSCGFGSKLDLYSLQLSVGLIYSSSCGFGSNKHICFMCLDYKTYMFWKDTYTFTYKTYMFCVLNYKTCMFCVLNCAKHVCSKHTSSKHICFWKMCTYVLCVL